MKAIYCPKCKDMVVPIKSTTRKCSCGEVEAWANDFRSITMSGHGLPIGINNNSLREGITNRPKDGFGPRLKAFILPVRAKGVRRIPKDKLLSASPASAVTQPKKKGKGGETLAEWATRMGRKMTASVIKDKCPKRAWESDEQYSIRLVEWAIETAAKLGREGK